MEATTPFYLSAEALGQLAQEILRRHGVPEEDAALTADCLVWANLHGIDTHGVIRLKVYVDRIREGGNNPRPTLRVIRETPVAAVLDGDNALGPVGGVKAMRLAIEKAATAGVGLVALRHSNHYGAAAYYATMALERDMIGFSTTNVLPSMPPTGGREARVGNNPLALAFPAAEEPPGVLDMATSRSSWGVLFTAAQAGRPLPEGCFLDAAGQPTVDPQAVLAGGALLPIADYKGYGLALCLGLLTGLLSDGHFDTDLPHPYRFLDQPGQNAFFMGALRIDQFLPPERFKARVDAVVRRLRNTPRAPGVERIYLPGEKEWEAARERRRTGIPLPPAMVEELRTLAESCGVKAACLP